MGLYEDAWYEDLLTVLDTETTGVDVASDRIVSIAIVHVSLDGQTTPQSWHATVDPGVEVPSEAAAVHGLTTEAVRRDGIPPRAALDVARRMLEHLRGPLVIFNAPFDLPLLLAEGDRHGLVMPGVPIIDPLCIDRFMDQYRKGPRNLAALAAHYDVHLPQAHVASADAVAAGMIARQMARRYLILRTATLEDLQVLQRSWYADWRDGANEHWERTGQPKRASGEWPLGPRPGW